MFLGYINDFTKILINNSIPLLCMEDTNVIITNANIVDFQSTIQAVFIRKNPRNSDIVTEHDNRRISNISYTKFMGITLDNTLHWKTHIDQLLPKMSLACYAIRVI